MQKICLRKRITSQYKTYDIILKKVLLKHNSGKVVFLGFYTPNQNLIKINKLNFTLAINDGAQMTNAVRHLLKKFLQI